MRLLLSTYGRAEVSAAPIPTGVIPTRVILTGAWGWPNMRS